MESRFWRLALGGPEGLAGRTWQRKHLDFLIWRDLGLFQLPLGPLGLSLWVLEPPEDTVTGGKCVQ